MNPHESTADTPKGRQRRREPMDRNWLEQSGLRYAARWESSAAGVGNYLERKIRERCDETGESSDPALAHVPEVVEQLIERGYVDDARFALATIDRMRRQDRSTAQIEARLRTKGLPESVYRDLLQQGETDHEYRAAYRLAQRRRIGPYCQDPEERERDRDRHLAILARRGFDLETAERVIDAKAPPESI